MKPRPFAHAPAVRSILRTLSVEHVSVEDFVVGWAQHKGPRGIGWSIAGIDEHIVLHRCGVPKGTDTSNGDPERVAVLAPPSEGRVVPVEHADLLLGLDVQWHDAHLHAMVRRRNLCHSRHRILTPSRHAPRRRWRSVQMRIRLIHNDGQQHSRKRC